MNQQTIYFLQALWDLDIKRTELENIAQSAFIYEIESTLKGILDENTIWVSEDAKKLKKQIYDIKNKVVQIVRPSQLINMDREMKRVVGEIRALQIKTSKTLDEASGVIFRDLHIIVKQLYPYTLKKIKQQTYYQLYRFLILNGKYPENNFYLPSKDCLEEWICFYKNKLLPIFEQLNDQTLDGRWAYERKRVVLNEKIIIEQFVSVKPFKEEIQKLLGKPSIGIGNGGSVRIFGRGYISNLEPIDVIKYMDNKLENNLSVIKDFSFITNENINPIEILDKIWGKKKYLVSPEEYFEFINKYIIADTFYFRIKLGHCIYCGAPLYHGKCQNCKI